MQSTLLISTESANRKLGEVNATYRPVGVTCPSNCELLPQHKGGCYANRGTTGFQAIASKRRNDDFSRLLTSDRKLTRHHVSGDVFNDSGELDIFYVQELIRFYRNNPDHSGWLYTHNIVKWDNAGFTCDKIPQNLTVLASCDHPGEVEYAKENGWKYARVTETEAIDTGEAFCPIDRMKSHGATFADIDNVNCKSCKICFSPKFQQINIVFIKQKPGKHNR